MPARAAALRLTIRTLGLRPVSRLVGGRPIESDRGEALDPQLQGLLAIERRIAPRRMDELGPVAARRELRRLASMLAPAPAPVRRVADRSFDAERYGPGPPRRIGVRVYDDATGSAARPALIYFHGGGFVVGDLETHDDLCRFLARRAAVTVVSVDYRLAPEDPFPAAVDDAIAAFTWARAHADELGLDPSRLAIGGDSAGGNLAAVVCQQLRARGAPLPSLQLLLYPATDLSRSFDSHRTFRAGFFLQEPVIDWFLANYLTDPAQRRDPRGSPIVTRDLSGLPPAHVVVAGFDPLRDEGEAYAHALMAAGVPTSLRGYESLVHGFYSMAGGVEAARWALEDLADVLTDRL